MKGDNLEVLFWMVSCSVIDRLIDSLDTPPPDFRERVFTSPLLTNHKMGKTSPFVHLLP